MSDDQLPPMAPTFRLTITEHTAPSDYMRTVFSSPCDNRPDKRKLNRNSNKKDRWAPFRKYFR